MKIELANGKTVNVRWCVPGGNALGINATDNLSIAEYAALFDAPDATREIIAVDGEQQTTYTGYTVLTMIAKAAWGDGSTQINLVKGDE